MGELGFSRLDSGGEGGDKRGSVSAGVAMIGGERGWWRRESERVDMALL